MFHHDLLYNLKDENEKHFLSTSHTVVTQQTGLMQTRGLNFKIARGANALFMAFLLQTRTHKSISTGSGFAFATLSLHRATDITRPATANCKHHVHE